MLGTAWVKARTSRLLKCKTKDATFWPTAPTRHLFLNVTWKYLQAYFKESWAIYELLGKNQFMNITRFIVCPLQKPPTTTNSTALFTAQILHHSFVYCTKSKSLIWLFHQGPWWGQLHNIAKPISTLILRMDFFEWHKSLWHIMGCSSWLNLAEAHDSDSAVKVNTDSIDEAMSRLINW